MTDDRRETLSRFLWVTLIDEQVDFGARAALGDVLNEFYMLPKRTYETIPTELLTDSQVDQFFVILREIAARTPILAEAIGTWEIWHGHPIESS